VAKKPKGTLFRIAPDFFAAGLMSAGWYSDQETNTQYCEIGLFNNDQSGRSLYVYAISIGLTNSNTAFGVVRNAATGALVNSGSNIDPSQGGAVGAVFFRRFGAVAPPFVSQAVPGGTVTTYGAGYVAVSMTPNHCLAIVPPGFQYSLISSLQTAEMSVGFWYLAR
jgi:hypothetical protein